MIFLGEGSINHPADPDLQPLLAAGVQGLLVEQLQVSPVLAQLALGHGVLRPGEALQQGGLQRADVPVQRLRTREGLGGWGA